MDKKYANEIINKVETLSENDEMVSLNDEYDRAESEKYSLIGIGKEEGIKETAKNMLKKNFSIKDISEVTGLSLDEIKSIEI